jgi:hypothetical protein
MFEHRVKDSKQLAHAGSKSHLLGLSRREQMLIETSNDGVVPSSHQSRHVKRRSDHSSPTPNGAFAPEMTAIPVEGSHSYQSGNSSAVQRTQFRKISQESGGKYRSDSRYALEQIVFLLPDGSLSNAMAQIIIDLDHLFFQPSDMSLDMCFDSLTARRSQSVSLRRKHLDQLTPASENGFQFLPLSVRQRVGWGVG